ncbi:MAG TPA: hypothetical protein VMF58_11670 [Rhizomicrobium sp.]|nr:hypothetical protein [Rhizomicrobium sp.]
MRTILIAAAPPAIDTIALALRNVARLVSARTFEDALAIVRNGIGLVIVGTFFDGSRMFDFLRLVKADEELRDVPVLCVRGISVPTDATLSLRRPLISTFAVTDNAVRALGAAGYFDLCGRTLIAGERVANEEFAALARKCLSGEIP